MAVKALLDPLKSQVRSLWGDVHSLPGESFRVPGHNWLSGTLVIVIYWAAPYRVWSHS